MINIYRANKFIKQLTNLTSSKLSSYCPPNSLTITSPRSFLCFLELLLTNPEMAFDESLQPCHESTKELPSSNDPGLVNCFLFIELLCKTKSPLLLRPILVDGSESRHRHGLVCGSTTDEPITDKAPTISLRQSQLKGILQKYNDTLVRIMAELDFFGVIK